ncbi:Uncharacterised protein [Raoultella terrigena]|uniref:Uncharacterized protein n=1 Tax=Raoultella terrigena TaxID=577 RepID=A0A4U9CXG1_RAOTE|nr:Uncharacterised protein [Raoultella terrigena]
MDLPGSALTRLMRGSSGIIQVLPRLLEKQGFRRIQILEKAWHLDGVDYDDWIYRLER